MNHFDLPVLREKVEVLNEKQMAEGFWDDTESAQTVIKVLNHYQSKINKYEKLKENIESAEDFIELMEMEEDYTFYDDFVNSIEK